MRILIIDDEMGITQFFSRAAVLRGFDEVETAATGEEALACVMRKRYDLITLDIRMPGLSGLEVIAMLRNLNPHAIIAVVSGFIPEEISPDVASCIDVLLPKPVSMETFNELIDGASAISATISSIRDLGLAVAVGG